MMPAALLGSETVEVYILGAVALVAAFVIFAVLDAHGLRHHHANVLTPLRRLYTPVLDHVLSQHGGYGETNVTEAEYVGTHEGPKADLEEALYEAGYRRYPLASLASTEDGRTEVASWAYHERVWSTKQDHARIFDAHPDVGDTDQSAWDVYAHREYNAHHPLYARKHYRGKGLRPAPGVENVRAALREQGIDLLVEEGEGTFEDPKRRTDGPDYGVTD